jgi:outer membrane protein assembly factor BamB
MRTALTVGLISLLAGPGLVVAGGEPVADVLPTGGLIAALEVPADLLVDLAGREGFLVQGLYRDPDQLAAARQRLREAGRYGPGSARLWRGALPYAENLLSVLVVGDGPAPPEKDILRALSPRGAAVFVDDAGLAVRTLRKPWPDEIDHWSHYLHDAGGNAVADDTVVGPPRRVQWKAGPQWTRAHEKMSSFTAMVSAEGRVFSIHDEGVIASMAMPARWRLVARDAFNGTVLWKRDIDEWWPRMFGFKAGPVFLTRRLVASGDRVYVTLGARAPLTILDATTGKTLRTCDRTANVEEIIVEGDTVFVSCHDPDRTAEGLPTWINKSKKPDAYSLWHPEQRVVRALDAATGEQRWQRPGRVNPQTLAADDRRVYYHDGENVVALDRRTGEPCWTSRGAFTKTPRSDFRANLVVRDGVVVFSGGQENLPSYDAGVNDMVAFSADRGERLWTAFHPHSGYEAPKDLFVIDGVVWSGATVANRPMPKISPTAGTGTFIGYDLRTGKEVARFAPDVPRQWFHHRCYPAKATSRFFLTSRQGVEFVEIASGHWDVNHWVRGACLYGVMPANGLLYAPPHPCGCRPVAKLNGLWALAPEAASAQGAPAPLDGAAEPLVAGPAYGTKASPPDLSSDAWPMYRRDIGRGAAAASPVPGELSVAWRAEPGGTLTAPTIGEGKVLVARVDDHSVRAFDLATGREAWTFTAGGPVDTPPTICGKLSLLGCRDGWVYALRTDDGALAWRYRVAPRERMVVADGAIESAWPVHGSVLVRGTTAYCLAGRSMFLDGGMHLVRIETTTGKAISRRVLNARGLDTELRQAGLNVDLSMQGARADVLVGDEENLYLKTMRLDETGRPAFLDRDEAHRLRRKLPGAERHVHLFAPQGFLDETWHHRSYTVLGTWYAHGSGGFYQAAGSQPAGRLLVHDGQKVYGFGKRPAYFGWSTAIEYRLFAADRVPKVQRMEKLRGYSLKTTFATTWSVEVPLHVKAMAKAGDRLVLAGTPDDFDEGPRKQYGNIDLTAEKARRIEADWRGHNGAWLWVVDARTGRRLGQVKLDAAPAWDALAVAGGQAVLSLKTGQLLCLRGRR